MLTLQTLAAKRQIKGKRGFTLMEILIVLAIIAMLVAIIGPNIFKRFSHAKVTNTAIQMKSLESGLQALKLDIGRDPTDDEGLALLVTDAGVTGWNGPYITGNVLPKDAWGNDYIYQAPADSQSEPVILSYGADGKEGGAGDDADITNAATAG